MTYNISIKNRNGKAVAHNGVTSITLDTPEGEELTIGINNEVEKSVDLDFSNGNMIVVPEGDDVFSKVEIQKPENLIPDNIAEGVDIAGIIGTLVAGGGGGDHTLTFKSENGTMVLGEKTVMNGDTSGDPISLGLFDEPVKEDTAQFDYSFGGWSLTPGGEIAPDALENITADKTLYAGFIGVLRFYAINYYDGDTLLHSESLAYGTTPSYVPVKEGYEFVGWDKTLAPVTGDADYYAQFVFDATAAGTCGGGLAWVLDKDYTLTISGTGDMYDYSYDYNNNNSTAPWHDYNADIKAVIIEEGVTSIGMFAFASCKMSSISIPDGCIFNCVKSSTTDNTYNYKGHQFMYCSNLKSLVIPEGNMYIPVNLCRECYALESVVIPATARAIGETAFRDCSKLTSVTIPSNVYYIGGSAFRGTALTSAIFQDTATWEYWKYNSSWTKIEKEGTIPSSDLADSATAATYLTNTYMYKYWMKL